MARTIAKHITNTKFHQMPHQMPNIIAHHMAHNITSKMAQKMARTIWLCVLHYVSQPSPQYGPRDAPLYSPQPDPSHFCPFGEHDEDAAPGELDHPTDDGLIHLGSRVVSASMAAALCKRLARRT
eukprot:8779990-Pyramimonas_sp.AAC.1